jgi:hypothetical protein
MKKISSTTSPLLILHHKTCRLSSPAITDMMLTKIVNQQNILLSPSRNKGTSSIASANRSPIESK